MFCPKCGTKIKGDVRFCPQCGAELPKAAPPRDGTPPVPDGQTPEPTDAGAKKPRKALPFLLALAALLVVIVLVVAIVLGTTARSRALRRFLKSFGELDAEEIMETVPRDFLRDVCEAYNVSRREFEDDLERWLDDAEESGILKEADISHVSIEESSRVDNDDKAGIIENAVVDISFMDRFDTDRIGRMFEIDYTYLSKEEGKAREEEEETGYLYRYRNGWYHLDALEDFAYLAETMYY